MGPRLPGSARPSSLRAETYKGGLDLFIVAAFGVVHVPRRNGLRAEAVTTQRLARSAPNRIRCSLVVILNAEKALKCDLVNLSRPLLL